MLALFANHVWQSTLFGAVAGALALALRRNPARIRHALWLAASLKFLVPFSIFIGIGGQVGSRTAPVAAGANVPRAIEKIAEPVAWSFAPAERSAALFAMAAPLLPIWGIGLLAVTAWRWRQWRRVRSLVRVSAPLSLAVGIPVRSCPSIEPGVYGILRPVLLLPAGIAGRLTPAQLQAILAHELCHVQRRDNLFAVLHMAVEAIFWFHPLVWFVGARLVDERERACDEEVLRLGNRAEDYAGSILHACRLYLESPLPCVSGVTGAGLRQRIERIMAAGVAPNLDFTRKVLLAGAAVFAVAAPLAIGLLRAQAPSAFEVASVKPARPGERAERALYSPGGKFNATGVTLRRLVQIAYQVEEYRLTGGPAWIDSERYEIEARAEANAIPPGPLERASIHRLALMLQTLLADRFHLVVHRESKAGSVYALVIANGGPKLVEQKGACPDSIPSCGDFTRIGGGFVIGPRVTIADVADVLSSYLGRPVLDQTGVSGYFNVKLQWTPDRLRGQAVPEDGQPSREQRPDPNGPSLFTAIQEQLGLKLEAQKGVIETIVIDHAEKPTEN